MVTASTEPRVFGSRASIFTSLDCCFHKTIPKLSSIGNSMRICEQIDWSRTRPDCRDGQADGQERDTGVAI